jgi:hypothetical protein
MRAQNASTNEQSLTSNASTNNITTSAVTPRDGGPLSHLITEKPSETSNSEQLDPVNSAQEDIDFDDIPVNPQIFNNPEIPFDPLDDNQQIPVSRWLEIPDTDVTTVVETTEEGRPSLPDIKNTSVIEDQPTLGINWDGEESWDRRFIRMMTEDKRQRR